MNKKKLAVLMALFAVIAFAPTKSFADISDSETYTVTIPSANAIVLAANATNFGSILVSEFGTGNPAAHNIIVGDGSAGSTSYVQSNDPDAGSMQYTLSFAGNGGSAVTLSQKNSRPVITLDNAAADPTASVDIIMSNNAKTAYPGLGATSPVNFAISGSILNIAASSSVPFDTGLAPLNMLMDLDEATVTVADAAGDISFDVTFTAVGLN